MALRALRCAVVVLIFGMGASGEQAPQQAQSPGPLSGRASAPVDLSGYWVALITEEWRWRMMTPPKGDYASVPLNEEGIQAADQWDLASDQANGEQCRPFGAAGLMRLPLRVRVSWADENTLRLETDRGQQMRLFHFGDTPRPGPEKTWQGFSVAEWRRPAPRQAAGATAGSAPSHGSLKVVTRNLRSGYLRKNGVPYSEGTVMTEYYERISGFGNEYLTVTTIVEDPTYLTTPFVTSSHFKKEPDGSKWNPTPCHTDPPATGE